ncbi:MAG TPA: hypothetical protein VHU40_19585 [Polyangia bacterium]|nr:hypothetical protein [Polyangia bacterium]
MNNLSSRLFSRRSVLAYAVTLLLGTSACTLEVEAEAPDFEVTQHDIAISGIPAIPGVTELSTHLNFTQQLPDLNLPNGFDSSVQAAKIDFKAKSGVSNLSFLHMLKVSVTTGNTSKPLQIIDYTNNTGTVVGDTLTVVSPEAVNILKEWKDTAVFDIDVGGALPAVPWTADITVHLGGSVSYKY